MEPCRQPRRKRNLSKVDVIVSFVFHAILALAMVYFAARQGLLGTQLKKISIEMVKEKPPEKPKQPEKPKVETPRLEQSKATEAPKIVEAPKAEAPPAATQPTIAPPPAEVPSFDFDGGKVVESSSDPVQLYKGYVEYTLRQKWHRPENMADDSYAVEVEITIDREGRISNPRWLKSSGDREWDQTVRAVFAAVNQIDRPPPANFPPRAKIRFDVQEETEPVLP
jgi:TonB family protein